MSCGCANNNDLSNKVLNLETMRNMSIDEITDLYRQGYKLEDSHRHIPKYILQNATSGNIQSLTIRSYANIIDTAAYWNGSSTFPMLLYGNSGSYGYVHLEAYLSPYTVISNIRECANIMTTLYRLAIFPAVSGAVNNIMFRSKGCDSTATETCTTCTGGAGEYITRDWTNSVSPGAYITTPPSTPTGLTVTPGNGELALYWNAATDPLTGGEVFAYKVTITGPNGTTGYRQSGTPGRTVTISGLTNGASYSISVKSLSYNNVESTGAAIGTGTPIVPCPTPAISVTCPTSPINQGTLADIVATITTAGTPNYTYKLYVDTGGTPIDTFGPISATSHTFSHIFNETRGLHTYKVEVVDSCTTGAKTVSNNCSLNIQVPANIIATNITATPSIPCTEGTCTVNISVTWQNTGDVAGSFVPNISIDGTPITPIYSSESVGAGLTMAHTFTVSGLTKIGSPHSICPIPN